MTRDVMSGYHVDRRHGRVYELHRVAVCGPQKPDVFHLFVHLID